MPNWPALVPPLNTTLDPETAGTVGPFIGSTKAVNVPPVGAAVPTVATVVSGPAPVRVNTPIDVPGGPLVPPKATVVPDTDGTLNPVNTPPVGNGVELFATAARPPVTVE